MKADAELDREHSKAKAYRSISSLQRDIRACRLCIEAGYFVDPRPVFEGHRGQRTMIIGQAPGEHEGAEGRPWRGRAGRTLRRWLDVDEFEFYDTFYCTSITRCYPGKSGNGRGDRAPSPAEIELCKHWRLLELKLVRPRLIITVGGLALRHVLGEPKLTECVGQRYTYGDAVAVPLPHPSGASGWLNAETNRARLEAALAIVRQELARTGARGEHCAD